MFQIKWTKKALLSFADTLKFWNEAREKEIYFIPPTYLFLYFSPLKT